VSGRSGQIEGLLKQPGDSKGHAGRGGRLALADCVNTLQDLGLVFFYDYDTIQGTYTHVMTLLIDFGWRSQLTLDESLNTPTVDTEPQV